MQALFTTIAIALRNLGALALPIESVFMLLYPYSN